MTTPPETNKNSLSSTTRQVKEKPINPGYGTLDASFKAAGGISGIRKLVEDFYQIMDNDSDNTAEKNYTSGIRAMHSRDLTTSIDKLTLFLCGWLGGPRKYSEKYGPISIPQAHQRLSVGKAERDAWLKCMGKAIAEQNYQIDFAQYLLQQLKIPAERIYQLNQKNRK